MGKAVGVKSVRVVLLWVERDNVWHMYNRDTDFFIQEFYNCKTINDLFEGLSKEDIYAKMKQGIESKCGESKCHW